MAKGINKWYGIGNIGSDPEIRAVNGKAVANFSIGCSETWKDKTTGERVEKTEWVRIVAWGRLAEIVGEYLKKGSKVYVEGKLQTKKWQDNQGQDRYTTEIIANEMQMLDSRNTNPKEAAQAAAHVDGGSNGAAPDFDDDIPF